MTKLRLKYIHAYNDRHGKRRLRVRLPGRKEIPLPGLPGSAEFMAAYQAALSGGANMHEASGSGSPAVVTSPGRGTVAAAVSLYLGTMAFGTLAGATQRDRRTILAHFKKEHGDKPLALLQRKHVQKILDEKAGNPHGARGS